MILNRYSQFFLFFGCFLSAMLFFSCEDRLESEQIVYSNDFSGLFGFRGIENAKPLVFNGDTVSGNYNNEEVSVNVSNLPEHNILKVEVEILIHDFWNGNTPGVDGVDGPDFWYMRVDNKEVYRTTFSNSPCESTFCLRQSYPNTYFRQNDPKSGAIETNLPGFCSLRGVNNWTSKYRVTQLVAHTSSNVKITLGDILRQTNTPDPKCDESWSLSKVELTALVVL